MAGGIAVSLAQGKRVGLMATCMMDALSPETGEAVLRLLEHSGFSVAVPMAQTCCGQPNWNGGDRKNAAALARRTIEIFEPYDYVVVPSGSCGGQLRIEYPVILAEDPLWSGRAAAFARKCFELTSFLVNVAGVKMTPCGSGKIAMHDSCSALRQMAATAEPRQLLRDAGYEPQDNPSAETCCGFGGLFSVKYGDVSARMGSDKLDALAATGATTVTSCDLGCLIHLRGLADRQGRKLTFRHIAELLSPPEKIP